MSAHRRKDAGKSGLSVQAREFCESSLEFKHDRVENRVFNECNVSGFRDRRDEEIGRWRQRRIHCSARTLSLHRVVVR